MILPRNCSGLLWSAWISGVGGAIFGTGEALNGCGQHLLHQMIIEKDEW
jgi:hypothetical protein